MTDKNQEKKIDEQETEDGKKLDKKKTDGKTKRDGQKTYDGKKVVVTCSIDEGSVKRVEEQLRDVGFEVEKVLEFTGNIVGFWSKPLESLRKLPEVDAVEESEMNYPSDR